MPALHGKFEIKFNHLPQQDRKSTRLNSSHGYISYAVFCLKKNKFTRYPATLPAERTRPAQLLEKEREAARITRRRRPAALLGRPCQDSLAALHGCHSTHHL